MTKSNLSRELHKLVTDNKNRQNMDLVINKSLEHQSNELELKIASLQSEKDDLMRQLQDKEENQVQTIAILTSEHESKIAALDRELNVKTRELSERESEVLQLNKSIGETGDFDEKAFTEHEATELISIDNLKSMLHSILVKSGNHTCELDDLADKSHTDWECDLSKSATYFDYSTIVDLLKALPSVASIQDNRVGAVAKDETQRDSEHVNMRDGSAEFILVCHSGSQDRDKAANLKITPSSIVFPAAKDVTATLNNQHTQLIQFRIIDTGNNISEYFKFVPFEGFVEPEKSVDIKVTCRKEPPSGYQIHVEYREAIVSVSNAKDW
ncbi:hypothetical protein Ddc_18772 [Ditylenchus destructor]|nr:hypothetical protein Ddc_18772 [Ditylenchus destructor]